MKLKLLITTVVLLMLTSTGLSKSISGLHTNLNREKAIVNYLTGLLDENVGLKTSSAYFLGELISNEAVIPLMKELKSSDNEGVRIAAALALFKIGDARGIFSIRQAIRFDESDRVRNVCMGFYQEYLAENRR